MTFALLLNAWRRSRGWTHPELAAMLGVSVKAVQNYTQGLRLPAPDVLATLKRMGFVPPPFVRRGPGRPMVIHA